MGLVDKIDNDKSIRKFLKVYLPVMAVLNAPQFFITATTPREELKPTLSEQIIGDTEGLRDISGGTFYAHFRFAGTVLGYAYAQSASAHPRFILN